ncbi:signal transduction histidine kinase/ligand-binding sensor domain-containing protein/DNA-binding response OmpR family regulator [Rhabdobacter roseus]|uniref:histidine kinase n=1 Tax=Rhabdobacter roseus TaxID=1655419 RepID=A0A840TF24_9BACT|nr:two-component regulator propeller domain-containing protein [Rhabdobacter roseus]MBB5282716.1 signal transduction histidine kinase/ligand-binding sensor domain-containing protein/DNA-binding response OmpR family regulator [Rhabdobacter roseus]
MKWVIQHIIFLLGTCLVSVTGFAQAEFNQFRFEHITVNQGLPHSDALCVAQDQAGFIWVGTNKGVVRYDGYSLKKYNLPLNDQEGINSNRVRALHVDPNGRLWVGVERAGLYYYDATKDQFAGIRELAGATRFPTLVDHLSHTNVHALCTDSQHRLWVSSQHDGLFALQTDARGALRSMDQIRLATPPHNEPTINRLTPDGQDRIWIGTLGYGLWVFNARHWKTNPTARQATRVASYTATNVRALHFDKRGDLWVGSDGQISWVGAQELRAGPAIRPQALPRSFAGIEKLFLDSFDRLWISTNYGLLLMEAGVSTSTGAPVREQPVRTFLPQDTDPGSINSVRVHDILEDRFHNLWFATSAGGLNQLKLRAKPFGLLRRHMVGQTTVADNYINAIYKDEKANRLWWGTRNGFASYDFSGGTYQNYLSQTLSGTVNGVDVSAVYQAKEGTLWIGTRYSGLYTLSGQSPSALQRLPNQPGVPGWEAASIESIVEDRNGTIWVATFNLGIHAFNRQGKYLYTFDRQNNASPTQQFTMLYAEPDRDILWASTRDAGVLKLQIQEQGLRLLRQFKHEPNNPASLRTNYTWPLLQDKQGTLWIGTIGGGLHRLVPQANGQEVVERYSQWVPETDIESLLMDESGHLWIGGSGLYQFNPTTKQLHQYDVSDGLQSNAFKVGAAYRATDGTMYFGGTNGITFFQPRAVLKNPFPPLVQITGLRVLNEPVGVGDTLSGRVLLPEPLSASQTIKLKASENDFTVEFVGLNYANPQKQQYAYRLEGYNDQWVQTTPDRRMATFANLPAGDYTFHVKASNDDGVWSTEPATLHFTILPPWWKTWWAYLLYTALIGGALYLYHRYEMGQQELKNKLALEQYKVEKEKEMTDTKLQFFTNISHELRTPLTLILGPMEELAMAEGNALQNIKGKMLLMHQQTRKLLDLVNQLLEFRKVETGFVTLRASQENVITFLTEIYLIFKLKAEELGLDYAMKVPNEAIPLYFDRHKLEIVLTNLLSNAFKYTPAGGKIRIRVESVGSPLEPAMFEGGTLQGNYLQLAVSDGGVGMEAEEMDKIFDPYYQASHTGTLRIMGTGVGLSLVKQFVEAHSGQVSVQSERGVGTTFTVRLPFGKDHLTPEHIREEPTPSVVTTDLPAHAATAETPNLMDAMEEKVRSARILLVEDNDELRQYIQQLISPTFEVFLAVDGLDGWEKALDLLPDLMISDIMMPRSNGLELCRKIKQHPKTGHIPVILLTARTAATHELEGLETGADEYMAKPFNPRLLYTKIAVMLQNRFRLKEYYQRQILLQPTEMVIPDEERQLLEKAMHIVESNLGNSDFAIPTLVREMGMSQSAFYRQIKAITGQSVVEFIRDIRLKQAAQLLATTHLRIAEVASMVGFNDPKYFRKIFQELYILSPSEYAKQHRQTVALEK